MIPKTENIVTVNAGSSSIKLTVFSHLSMLRLLDVSVSGIGQEEAKVCITRRGGLEEDEERHVIDHQAAANVLLEVLRREVSPESVGAIGHRLVHGSGYDSPVLINAISDNDWTLLSHLDPNHTPLARLLVDEFMKYYPHTTQVACFDTAFFNDLPQVAKILPLPKKYRDAGVRRYGFHGLAYTSLLSTFRKNAGQVAADGRVILAHLGSGASVTATQHGKPVDTTMGFTPTSGVTMSTRSGDLDPAIYGFLHRENGMRGDEFDHMINFESGLLGVSNITGDMYSLLQMEAENEDAALAIELFVHDIKKAIGGYTALLGGIDSLIFSGGIGEQSAPIRGRICQGLEYLGIEIDEASNLAGEFLISSGGSGVGVHVIAADEAGVIAEQVVKVLER